MPVVPTFSAPQVQPPRMPGIRLNESAPNTGGGVARGIDMLSGILEQERLRADRTAVTAADTSREQWANTRLYDPEGGAFNLEGKAALGVTNSVLADYDKQTAQIAAGLNGLRQQDAFQQSSQAQRVALQGQLSRFEFQQRSKYEDETASARIATAVQSGALNYNDPTTLGQSRQAILSTVDTQGRAKGWDDTQIAAARLSKLADLHTGVIERMIADKAFGPAKRYLANARTELSADDQLKLTRALDAAEREGRNELAAAVRQQISDLSASYKAGLPVPSGQELSLGVIEAAFPGKGREIWSSLQADKRFGADVKDLNQQSPAQLADTLKKYEVTQGGAGAADALERQNDLQRAARASIEARQKNPAQFAIDNGLGYKPLPANPDEMRRELQNRESVRAQMSQQVGVPVPMLTPDEAKQIGKGLDATDAKSAVQTFDYLRGSVGDQAYTNIMQQIAPDSPVKAYAGQIYGKNADVALRTHWFSANETAPARVIAETLVTGENIINKTKGMKAEDGKPVSGLYLPNKAQFDSAFVDKVGDAFAGRPDAQSLALQVAYAYYVGKSAQTGRLNSDTQDVDSKLLQESLRAAVGEVVSFHGYGDVIAPLGMDASTFNERARAAFAAEIQQRSGGPLASLYAQFPGLRKYDVQFRDSRGTGKDWRGAPYAGRKMEFYPPDESYNPNPGKPTIEVFANDVSAKDALGEIFSHYLPRVDPQFREARSKFITSIDSKQKEMLRGDYENQIGSGVFGSNRPTFEQWLSGSGGDAFFRGYVADQYPKKFYRPDQIEIFDALMRDLRKGEPAPEVAKAMDAFGNLGLRNWKGNQYLVTKGREPFSLNGQPIIITVAP